MQRDVAIIGGGVVGLATAMALGELSRASVVVLEAEDRLAAHQSGHNSGVIHSGLYYRPGSLKARLCIAGREAMYRFCAEHDIAHQRCGKLVAATHRREIPALEELARRGTTNGLHGLRLLRPEEVREREPHVVAVAGLWVAETGIVDFRDVAEAYARIVRERGGEVLAGARVTTCARRGDGFVLGTERGEVACRALVNCAGLQADRVARRCGADPGVTIVPFRGEYHALVPERVSLVRNPVYPVPDPRYPFLGAHFTRTIRGGVEVGPNAVLGLAREGYGRFDVSARDVIELATNVGFWRMAARYWRTGLAEQWRSLSKRAFVASLRRLVPELRAGDLRRAGAGVRAQAVAPDGTLVDDFHIVESERAIHVLNAPSPAATASIAIGREIAGRAVRNFGLAAR